jgi:phosphoribosylaminoimidazolecarboxamide formyltransferase/IMP cyclohydrolase
MINLQRALISCWDKSGLEDLCDELIQHNVEIISSGGTADYLMKNDIHVTLVEDVTGSPEILGGRVKTLHPVIHAGLLADNTQAHGQDLDKIGAKPIQLVVVNLYPFVEKAFIESLPLEDAIEFIDIGGPAMLRAAAKNYKNVVALHKPFQYSEFKEVLRSNEGKISVEFSRKKAQDIFFYTSWYDGKIQEYFGQQNATQEGLPDYQVLPLVKDTDLRYGENPHQPGAIYYTFLKNRRGLSAMEQLWGKQLSFNNYMDIDAAYSVVNEFAQPAVAIIKHMNPCGAAIAKDNLTEAFEKAMKGDSVSAFGGIVALNRIIERDTAEAMSKIFFECIIAPEFGEDAMEILKKKKNLRLLKMDPDLFREMNYEVKSINGAYLFQKPDIQEDDQGNWEVVTETQPDPAQMEDLKFTWKICKHVKSNAIVIGKDLEIYGIGAGQMSRVDSVEISTWKAKKGDRQINGAVLASDAFFPFRDGIDQANEAGIKATIQPGGSIRDEEVINAANEHGMTMILTHTRHFKH